ncbi:MAG: hypothetical protein PHQ84_03140 [Candidatus Omnitrophica bacterium]|jgi:dihydroxyacetone kinase-like predicted kinase|nr:hypothetical protein [Candidatus Omnitrophota bacterium]MDD3274810.1 hypothetical protein [Candidatus Omnitrophota bacterium]MDD5077978.1 hypothetical protein [Candidatus Omnitrophota bacterium]MDD5724744.1 hypothetical protein [Candidatus Omnitrophota bacterium]
MITLYVLDFVLHARNSSPKAIRNSLAEFGTDLTVAECQEPQEHSNYKISMVTEDPTLVFDLCSQFGRIRSVKIQENSRI